MSRSTSMYAWGAATHTSAGAGTAIRVGSYVEGQWLISIVSMSGTNPRLRPRWESAPGTVAATAGPFGTLRFMPTMLATGIAIATLHVLGAWGRPAYSIGGTSAAIKFQSWFVGSW
jgi:hypothetical protein